MKREEELTVSVKNLTRPIIGIENRTALEAFDIMVARIEGALAYPNSSPLLPNPKPVAEPEPDAWMDEFGEVSTVKPAINPQPLYLHPPKPKPVGWETDAEWDLEMRCANLTENTPFAEVSKLINDLWQQYCLAAEPKPEATEGGAHERRIAELEDALRPFAKAGQVIDSPFGPALFREDDTAFQSGCAWSENGERRTITWGDFRRARAALTAKQNDGREE